MMQKKDKSLEDLAKRFVYNIKRDKIYNLNDKTLKAILLNPIKMNGLIL